MRCGLPPRSSRSSRRRSADWSRRSRAAVMERPAPSSHAKACARPLKKAVDAVGSLDVLVANGLGGDEAAMNGSQPEGQCSTLARVRPSGTRVLGCGHNSVPVDVQVPAVSVSVIRSARTGV